MSDAHDSHDHDGPHEGPIKTPKQLIVAVVLSFVVPILAIILLVSYVSADRLVDEGTARAAELGPDACFVELDVTDEQRWRAAVAAVEANVGPIAVLVNNAGVMAYGAIEDTDAARTEAVARHFVAVSTALDKVAAFGIDPANAFGFWDWVGGRYSVDSAIGTSLAIAIGPDGFRDFLAGFHAVDEHFRTTPFAQNVPVLMGLLNVWYVNFLGAHTHAVLPYDQFLSRFPAYLQQLTMESNGKSVRWDGSPVTTGTGEIFWGEPGTNGQHAFYQLIHQGTSIIPAEFMIAANGFEPELRHQHQLLMSNVLAQSEALMKGRTFAEAKKQLTDKGMDDKQADFIAPHRVFTGNRPSITFVYDKLTGAEFLRFVAALYGQEGPTIERRIDELLGLFDLAAWKDELTESYSHGMRQKLIISSALIHRPELIVVDEPMVGLDPKAARLLKDLFRQFVARGGTVLMSTHTLEVAEAMCDRIAIIQHGKIVASGTMPEIREQTATGHGVGLEELFLKLTGGVEAKEIAEVLGDG